MKPAKYNEEAVVKIQSLLMGVSLKEQENSILFRGVRIRRGAVVRNSIVMQNGEVFENVIE